ncbi:MAG: NAD-dependent epimerase/dehydratase family protein [Limisphaerales bacterium]
MADFYNDNVLATQNIVMACERQKISRLIHVSTPSIYFDFTDRFNISESQSPAKPANHYVRTKVLAEAAVDAAAARGLSAITLRPRAIFGPGDTTMFPTDHSRSWPARFSHSSTIVIPLMDITFVENVVDVLLLAADAPTAALGKKFNVTNGEPWPRSRLLAALFAEINPALENTPRQLPYRQMHRWVVGKYFQSIHARALGAAAHVLHTVGVLAKSQTLDISSRAFRSRL